MGKVIDMEENVHYIVSVVACMACLHKWTACRPLGTPLHELECPNCGPGCVVETGMSLDGGYGDE